MNYLWLTLKHKWFVIVAGRRLRVSWRRLLLHDWTKLTPSEYPGYQRQFCSKKTKRPDQFAACWIHHQNHNDHHWEYWISRPDNKLIPMPKQAVREMVADWLAAGRAYEGIWPDMSAWLWLNRNIESFRGRLHELTWLRLENVLQELQSPLSYDCHIYSYTLPTPFDYPGPHSCARGPSEAGTAARTGKQTLCQPTKKVNKASH